MPNLSVDETYCKGCELCVQYCSKKVLAPSTRLNSKGYAIPRAKDPEKCIECGICERMCPEFAITVEHEEEACAEK